MTSGSKTTTWFRWGTVICMLLLSGLCAIGETAFAQDAQQASLYGMIVDEETKLPIDGASVNALSGERTYTTRTDGFGLYRMDNIEPGTYSVETRHPAYLANGESGISIAAGQQNRWQAELARKDTEAFFDIFVEVSCVTTGMKLKHVPVAVTVAPSSGSGAVVVTGATDDLGFVQFGGMPRGAYRFSINEGDNRIFGWESYSEDVGKEVTGPHWAAVRLKPETSRIIASVYGFNPVTERDGQILESVIVECEGVHPDDPTNVLVPAQVGISGLLKANDPNWNHNMFGKVLFEGLPHVHWRLRGKRLGYALSETTVESLPNDVVRINMALQDTQLTVIVSSPYNDPDMLVGLKVRLQGLKDSNTAGINRIRSVVHETEKDRAVVVFDKLLPGNYLMTVDDSVIKTVPILVEGEDIQDVVLQNKRDFRPSNRFSVHFTSVEYVDAVADAHREIQMFLTPEPMTFTGILHLVGIKDGAYNYFTQNYQQDCLDWHTAPRQKVEIRASQYYASHMPAECRLIEVITDDKGAFTVSLLPGLYGVVIPGLTDYFGGALTLEDCANGTNFRRHLSWPYYQEWPYSKKSAEMFMQGYAFPKWDSGWSMPGGIGGVGLSSGQRLEGWFLLPQKQFFFSLNVSVQNTMFELLNRTSGETGHLSYYFHNEGEHYLNLKGPENISAAFPDMKRAEGYTHFASLVGTTPGSYTVEFNHPDYTIKPGSLKKWYSAISDTFVWYDFPDPGVFPDTQFPENFSEWDSPYQGLSPLSHHPLSAELEIKASQVDIDVYEWSAALGKYVLLGVAHPQYFSYGNLGNRLFTRLRTSAISETGIVMWYKRSAMYEAGK